MDNDDILDLDLEFENDSVEPILECINWWESKRKYFIYTILFLQIGAMLLFIPGVIQFGIGEAIIGSIGHLIVANCFYSIGWGLEVLAIYYNLRLQVFFKIMRMFFLIIGYIFSVLITLVFYLSSLM